MSIAIIMPVLGLTMEEGTIAAWLKQVGDQVEKNEPLLTVEMDKGTITVPASATGVLSRILVQVGETVPVKSPIAELAAPGEGLSSRVFSSPRARLRAREWGIDVATLKGTGPRGRIVEDDVLSAAPSAASESAPVRATPLARRVALERGVPLGDVPGSGVGGRVTHDDVLSATEGTRATPVAPPKREPIAPLSRIRRITAERMALSARSVARVTLHLEADFTEAAALRRQVIPELQRLGISTLPWDAIIAKAAGRALAEHPSVNAEWLEGQGVRLHSAAHVGVAVALGQNGSDGLVVAVLRNADTRPLTELAADLLELVARARAGRLGPADIEGGTFSVSNLGQFRIAGFTPVVNLPEAAILGAGSIAEKPAVRDGQVVPRLLCTLSLAFDHRVVDGAPAAAFLARVADLLERPYALLLP